MAAVASTMTKRLLFIAHRVPYPPDKGERVRAFQEIRALAPHFRITLAALAHSRADTRAAEGLVPWCETVLTARVGGPRSLARGAAGLLAGKSVTEGCFASARLRQALRRQAQQKSFDLVMGYSSSTLPYVLEAAAGARLIDLVDADSAKWDAYADGARGPKRWLYRREARRVRELEHRALARCDAVVLVSEAEARAAGLAGEKVLPVGNGVDAEYFRPADRPTQAGPSLVFTGTMDYRPNVEGVCWFVREVWPALRREVPDLALAIVGRDPAPAVRRLQDVPGVTVTGAVPDVRPYLAAARAAVVPLLLARGIQNKVLEAMAMGRAVVASGAALEGLDLAVGPEVLRADTPDQWRQAVLEVIRSDGRRAALERAARARVEADYAWPARMAPLVALCRRLAGATKRGG